MDGPRPWMARALSSMVALVIAAGLFATASFLISAVMPVVERVHLHGAQTGLIISTMSSTMTTGVVMWLVLAGRRRKARAEPDIAPLPRLPKAG